MSNTGFNTYRVTLENDDGVLNTEMIIAETKRDAVVSALSIQKEGHSFIPIDVLLLEDPYSMTYIKGE